MKQEYQSPSVGQEISCVMNGVNANLLENGSKVVSELKKLLEKDKFTILNSLVHYFEPRGFTAFFLLSESHLAIHTYPEHNSIYFNLYSCRGPNDSETIFNSFKKWLKPKKVLFLKNEKVRVK